MRVPETDLRTKQMIQMCGIRGQDKEPDSSLPMFVI